MTAAAAVEHTEQTAVKRKERASSTKNEGGEWGGDNTLQIEHIGQQRNRFPQLPHTVNAIVSSRCVGKSKWISEIRMTFVIGKSHSYCLHS